MVSLLPFKKQEDQEMEQEILTLSSSNQMSWKARAIHILRAVYPMALFLVWILVVFPALFVLLYMVIIRPELLSETNMSVLTQSVTDIMLRNAMLMVICQDAIVLTLFLFLFLRDRRKSVALETKVPRSAYLYAVAIGIFSSIFLYYAIVGFDLYRFFPDYQALADMIVPSSLPLKLLAVGIAAPVVEELLFRGIFMGRLAKAIPAGAALVLQAVAFGIYHMNPLQSLYAFVLGLLLGYLYLKYKSILVCILCHAVINLIGSNYPAALFDGIHPAVGFFVGLIGVAVLLFFVRKSGWVPRAESPEMAVKTDC
jgi:membrane protease YdiL (CAAX protease family)